MSVAYLLLGGPDADEMCDPFIKGIVTPDRCHVFSIIDFLQIVLRGNKNRKYADHLWQTLCHQHSQFNYQGTLDLLVPSTKMPKNQPTAGTTVAGLRGVLDVLSRNHVTDATRKVVEDIFVRYMVWDRSMIVEIDLNAKEHPQIPHFTYNFQPPTACNLPVVSIVVEEAGAGAEESDLSMSIEYDFDSTEDHIVRDPA